MEFIRKSLAISSATALASGLSLYLISSSKISTSYPVLAYIEEISNPLLGISSFMVLKSAYELNREYQALRKPQDGTEYYSYPDSSFEYFWNLIALLIMIFLAVMFTTDKRIWIGIPAVAFWIFSLLGVLRLNYRQSRPVELDDNSISSISLFGERSRISWSDIDKIDLIRELKSGINYFGWRYRHHFLIEGKSKKIYIDDKIKNLPEILKILNEKSKEFKIPIFYVDRGEDTRRKIRETIENRDERKRLISEGVRENVSEFKNPDL